MKRILMLTKYGRLGASSRLRSYQYVPALEAAGLSVQVSPLLDDTYVRQMYSDSIDGMRVLSAYASRLRALLEMDDFDLAWVEKEMLPWLPAAIELPLWRRGVPVVVDYDDAMFHRYDQHRSRAVRGLLGHKVDAVMARASLVVAGNDYLAARARQAGASNVEILPTVVDLVRYPPRQADVGQDLPVVGWIGSPDTVRFLAPLFEVFRRLAATRAVRLVAVGARPDQVADTPFEAVEWNEASEVAVLAGMDVGIMPLQDTPWQRGKCGYKLIQYMACGLPVVASPVGVNATLVVPGGNGILATTQNEWLAALHALLDDRAMRERLGAAGRDLVESVYCLQKQAPKLARMLTDLAGRER